MALVVVLVEPGVDMQVHLQQAVRSGPDVPFLWAEDALQALAVLLAIEKEEPVLVLGPGLEAGERRRLLACLPVERDDDGFEVLDRLGLLELGDDGDPAADTVHHLVHEFDVGGRTHERQGDEVDTEPQREFEVLDVLLGQGGHGDVHPRQRHALVVADRSAFGDAADDRINKS